MKLVFPPLFIGYGAINGIVRPTPLLVDNHQPEGSVGLSALLKASSSWMNDVGVTERIPGYGVLKPMFQKDIINDAVGCGVKKAMENHDNINELYQQQVQQLHKQNEQSIGASFPTFPSNSSPRRKLVYQIAAAALDALPSEWVGSIGCFHTHIQKLKEAGTFWHGTRLHLTNSIISIAALYGFQSIQSTSSAVAAAATSSINELSSSFMSLSSSPSKSAMVLTLLLSSIAYDNIVNGVGKFIGDTPFLRKLTQGRLLLHASGMPLMAIPVTEIGRHHGIFPIEMESMIQSFLMVYATMEVIRWSIYNTDLLKVVDNRESKEPSSSHMGGILTYTSGRFMELVVPCIVVVLYQAVISLIVLQNFPDSESGRILLLSAIATIGSCSNPKRPDIQLSGELFHVSTLWLALLALP